MKKDLSAAWILRFRELETGDVDALDRDWASHPAIYGHQSREQT